MIREGDRIRIVKPVFVTRVGYPREVKDYLPQVEELIGEDFRNLLNKLQGRPKDIWEAREDNKQVRAIKRELAYLLAKKDGFGGRERTLHTVEVPEAAGREIRAGKVCSTMTGTYYPPNWYRDRETGYMDGEPGGLENRRQHRLIEVDPCMGGWWREEIKWIEVGNVELVEKGTDES